VALEHAGQGLPHAAQQQEMYLEDEDANQVLML
jgi:hypothetical protein